MRRRLGPPGTVRGRGRGGTEQGQLHGQARSIHRPICNIARSLTCTQVVRRWPSFRTHILLSPYSSVLLHVYRDHAGSWLWATTDYREFSPPSLRVCAMGKFKSAGPTCWATNSVRSSVRTRFRLDLLYVSTCPRTTSMGLRVNLGNAPTRRVLQSMASFSRRSASPRIPLPHPDVRSDRLL